MTSQARVAALFTLAAFTWSFLGAGGAARAGTTGSLSGTVLDSSTSAPVPDAHVTAVSPSQVENATTDATGRFTFASLAPDTYTVSAQKAGYQSVSVSGVTVFADNQQTLELRMHSALKTIANVTSRSAMDLVRPGTTADVYSVNAAQQSRLSVAGRRRGFEQRVFRNRKRSGRIRSIQSIRISASGARARRRCI